MHVDLFIVRCRLSKNQVHIVVRMCGSWEKIVVDQRRCRRILKQVKQCVLPIFAFLRLNDDFFTFFNVLMHVDLFKLGCRLSTNQVI